MGVLIWLRLFFAVSLRELSCLRMEGNGGPE